MKPLAVNTMRLLGMRHLVIRMYTINLCNLRCKMCYYSLSLLTRLRLRILGCGSGGDFSIHASLFIARYVPIVRGLRSSGLDPEMQ